MMNEFEIANFVTILDSINLQNLGNNSHHNSGMLKLALKCIFYAAYYTKIKYGDDDLVRCIRAFTIGILPDLDEKIKMWTVMYLQGQDSFDRNVGQVFMLLEKGFLPSYSLDKEWIDQPSEGSQDLKDLN